MELVDIEGVVEREGVYPVEVKYKKALCGDKSDNVAGIPRIGSKTAIRIIEECRPSEVNPEFTGADRICLHPKVAPSAGIFLANLRRAEAGYSSRKHRQQGGNSTIPGYGIQDRDGPELRDC
jgi:5'-3' exonuclease